MSGADSATFVKEKFENKTINGTLTLGRFEVNPNALEVGQFLFGK